MDILLELMRNRLRHRENTKTRYLNVGFISPEESTFSQADEKFLLKINKIITDNLEDSADYHDRPHHHGNRGKGGIQHLALFQYGL